MRNKIIYIANGAAVLAYLGSLGLTILSLAKNTSTWLTASIVLAVLAIMLWSIQPLLNISATLKGAADKELHGRARYGLINTTALDRIVMNAIREGRKDPYKHVAAYVFGKKLEYVTPEERRYAKDLMYMVRYS